ncbi:MAG: mercury transporter MerT [Alphaproteobacteria bacterium]|nr:MAG: mercury transporter MerT [Alphaproteobacteria bacterium]
MFEHDNATGDETPQTTDQRRGGLLATGGILGALIASSCCVAPLVLVTLGVSGAWIGNLTALEPYKPFFLVATALFLAGGFWHVYFRPKQVCVEGSHCARPASSRITRSALWIATVLALLSATVNLWAPLFY